MLNLQHVGAHEAYNLMKFDENYVDDFWYCYNTDNCLVLFEGEYIAYKYDSEASNDIAVEFKTFEEAENYLK